MKKKKSTDHPLFYFQLSYDKGVCVSYMETQAHYFYRQDENGIRRISGEEYVSAYEAYRGY